jgi:hypothetical protein
MAQIHAAPSYYEHQAEVDADIERLNRYVEEMRAQHHDPLIRLWRSPRTSNQDVDPSVRRRSGADRKDRRSDEVDRSR